MRKRKDDEAGWYRRNWKAVATIWGLLLGLFGIVGGIGWTAIWLSRPKPHVHVHTKLKVVAASEDYPLATCVVSGKPLPSPFKRPAVLYEGIEVQFCCEVCIPTFEGEPQKYLKVLNTAGR